MYDVYNELLIPGTNMLCDLQMNGMLVDTELLSELQKEKEKRIAELRDEIEELAREHSWTMDRYMSESTAKSRPDELNPNSPKQMLYLADEIFDLPNQGDTTDKEALNYWIENNSSRFAELLKEYREESKTNSNYLAGMWDKIEEDNRVYGNIYLWGVRTYRTRSKQPNLQNIQTSIRDIFVSPEDYVLVEIDFSQMELRVLAVESGDETLQEIYYEGKDVHDYMTRQVFPNVDEGTGEFHKRRKIIKRIVYGSTYGQTNKGVADMYNVDQSTAQEWKSALFDNMPEARDFLQENAEKPLAPNSTIPETRFGRRRRFELVIGKNREDVKKESQNFVIQSTASDVLLKAAINLWRSNEFNYDDMMLALIHDSILFEIPREVCCDVCRHADTVMEETAQNMMDTDMPMPVDVEIGKRWGSLEEISKDENGRLQFEGVDY